MTGQDKAEVIRAIIEMFGKDTTMQCIATLAKADRDALEKEFVMLLRHPAALDQKES